MLKIKKLLASIAAIAMIGGCIPLVSFAEDNTDGKLIVSDNEQNKDYYILYKDIDTTAIEQEAAQKRHEYIYSLYADGADDYEVEIKSTDYYQEYRLELIKAAYQEASEKVLKELEIDKEKAFCSMFSPTIVCSLTDEQIAIAEKSDLIESISIYNPIEPMPTTENLSYSTKEEFINILTGGKDASELFGENIKIDAELNCKNGESIIDYIIIYGLKSEKEIDTIINKFALNTDLRIVNGASLERSGTMFSISSDKINNTNEMKGVVFVDDEFPNWISKKDIPTFTKMYSFNPSKYIIRLGDTNNDYKIDATDASDILTTYSKLSTETDFEISETVTAKMDIDTNGKIDAADATLVLQYYAYLSTDGKDSLKEFIMNNMSLNME